MKRAELGAAAPAAAAGLPLAVAARATAATTVSASISVGSAPYGVAVDHETNTVYVANDGSGTVAVIGQASNSVTGGVGVNQGPTGIAAAPATGDVYVADQFNGGGEVLVIGPPGTSGSVAAIAPVNEVVSLSGVSGTMAFPPADPGTTSTATGAEAYTASTNDPAGYTLTLGASGSALTSASATIPNTNLTVTETGAYPGPQTFGPGSGATLTLAKTSNPSTNNYSDDWALTIPGNAVASLYSESFVYLVLGN